MKQGYVQVVIKKTQKMVVHRQEFQYERKESWRITVSIRHMGS